MSFSDMGMGGDVEQAEVQAFQGDLGALLRHDDVELRGIIAGSGMPLAISGV
jgi:hypothetical protein